MKYTSPKVDIIKFSEQDVVVNLASSGELTTGFDPTIHDEAIYE